ncbi:hypothetical protein KP1_10 [Klebsiella virus 2019KP1]|nr:hypothetical protein KP1_10 [Klebsiella virus 2019KP1]
MSMFKIGDKVVRKVWCGEDEYFISKLGGSPYYIVTSVSAGGRFLQVEGGFTVDQARPWYAFNFELYQEPGDELPPVPDSVSYLKENGRRKLVARINGDLVNLLLSLSYHNITDAVGYSMEPDAALQLAHDLRRMAMDIKRKEKAQ